MAGITCPYLGIKDDSETALAYPSQWNCCFRGGSPVALEVEHQRKYCLSTAYVSCPIYTETSKLGRVPDFRRMQGSTIEKQDQPFQGRVVQTRNISNKKLIISVVLLLCLLAIVFGSVWGKQFWNNWDERIVMANLFKESASETPILPTVIINVSSTIAKTEHTFTPRVVLVSPQVISQTPKKSLTNTSTVKPSSTIRIEVTETPAETRTPITTRACGVPAGWVQYIVRVGDTLSRLSRVYNVSIAELQSANCMGSTTQLYAGSVIYVPYVLTTSITEVTATQTKTSFLPSTTATKKPSATNTPIPNTATLIPTVTINPLATEDVLETVLPTQTTP